MVDAVAPWREDGLVSSLHYADVEAAAERIAGLVRPVAAVRADVRGAGGQLHADVGGAGGQLYADVGGAGGQLDADVWFALEQLQHTGTFKARGAQNFVQAHRQAGTLPAAGITIASGGNAGLACAWAAAAAGVPATVFVPTTAPAVKVARLRAYGADVRLVGSEYAEALAACDAFAADTGALQSHAYDHPLIAAGAGTLMFELLAQLPDLDTVVVAVGGGGLFAGVATVAAHHGVRTVAVEPEHCRALNAALDAGEPVDVAVDSVAADSLGARRASPLALHAAQHGDVRSVLVSDAEIVVARRQLWDNHRLAVEHAAAAALAAIVGPAGYEPLDGERVCVVLCGANTDPATLAG